MHQNRLILLANSEIEVGIIPDLGGRVALLRKPGKQNVLKFDPKIWAEMPSEEKAFSAETPWKAYNGHIVWLGPQSQWWTQQNSCVDKRDRKDLWPPDPYSSYGNYEIIEQSAESLFLRGPESPFTGIQLSKRISIDKQGRVLFHVIARNVRSEPVSWDLWLNSRVEGHAKCYVPVHELGDVRVASDETQNKDRMNFKLIKNHFTFDNALPSPGKQHRCAKAFVYPNRVYMAAFISSQAFFVQFPIHPKNEIHPEQGLVEIYNCISRKPEDTLLELEYHAPYRTLQNDETMEAEEQWRVLSYDGPEDAEAHSDFIQQNLSVLERF